MYEKLLHVAKARELTRGRLLLQTPNGLSSSLAPLFFFTFALHWSKVPPFLRARVVAALQ